MRPPEPHRIYSIEDLIDPPKKDHFAQVGYVELHKAGMIKNPSMNFKDCEGYRCTPVYQVNDLIELPLALIGYAIENPRTDCWKSFIESAMTKLRKAGVIQSHKQDNAQPNTSGLIQEHETLTFIKPKSPNSTGAITTVIAEITEKVTKIISAARAARHKKPAPKIEPSISTSTKKPQIYQELTDVPEFCNEKLERRCEQWAAFYRDLFGAEMPLDKLTYNGNIVDLRHSLNIKGALPVVHGSIQKFGNKSYLKHLINSASNFGQTILLEYLNPYDIRYPSKDFNNHPPKFAPVLIGGLGAHYAYDCIKHLSAPTPMRYEDPTISFLQMSLYNLRGKTQYEAFSKLASLDDVLAAFVFMGWARKNAPDLVNQYMELFTQSQRMLTSACAAGGVAITIELQSPNIIRVSMFSPAERLSWGVEKV